MIFINCRSTIVGLHDLRYTSDMIFINCRSTIVGLHDLRYTSDMIFNNNPINSHQM